jgi:hypothetical protein
MRLMKFDELEAQVLQLPPAARARVAHELVRSLDAIPPGELERVWLEEAERRDQEMDASGDEGVPGPEVFARIRERLS